MRKRPGIVKLIRWLASVVSCWYPPWFILYWTDYGLHVMKLIALSVLATSHPWQFVCTPLSLYREAENEAPHCGVGLRSLLICIRIHSFYNPERILKSIWILKSKNLEFKITKRNQKILFGANVFYVRMKAPCYFGRAFHQVRNQITSKW